MNTRSSLVASRLLDRLPDSTLAAAGLRRGGASFGAALLWASVGAAVAVATGASVLYFVSPRSRAHLRVLGQWLGRGPASKAADAASADAMVDEGSPTPETEPTVEHSAAPRPRREEKPDGKNHNNSGAHARSAPRGRGLHRSTP